MQLMKEKSFQERISETSQSKRSQPKQVKQSVTSDIHKSGGENSLPSKSLQTESDEDNSQSSQEEKKSSGSSSCDHEEAHEMKS
jgi:hypothetical protein